MTITEDNVFLSNRRPQVDFSEEKSIGHILINALGGKNSERVVFVDYASSREWTGKELKEKILNVAAALILEYNLKQGDVCLVKYPCSDWYMILSLAIISAGGVLATMDWSAPYDSTVEEGKKMRFKFFFCFKSHQEWGTKLENDLGYGITTILMDTELKIKYNFLHLFNYDSNILKQKLELPIQCHDTEKDWAIIQLTAGTTGTVKTALFSHANIIAELSSVCSPNPQEMVLSTAMTLDYVAGRKIVFCGLYMGYKLILLNEHDIKLTLEVIEKYRVKMLYLSAFTFYNLMTSDLLNDYNIDSVEIVCAYGSKLVFMNQLREFLKEHEHIKYFTLGYGTTEVGTVSRDAISSEEFLNSDHGTGTLECFNKIRIVDLNTGENLDKNKRGEVRVWNPMTFLGYIDFKRINIEGRDSPLINGQDIFDELGYYITGDIGYMNDKEELFVEGRLKECLNLVGWKIQPEVLEEKLLQQKIIHSVCVIGIKDKNNPVVNHARAYVKVNVDICLRDLVSSCSSSNNTQLLEYKGIHNSLCSLPKDLCRLIAKYILDTYEEGLYQEHHLIGGIVILDELKALPRAGKVDKQYLKSLTLDQVEVYGDRSDERFAYG